MGYALRHLSDLSLVFKEFHRVLKPNGTACILEITRPPGKLRQTLMKAYMRFLVPALTRFATHRSDTQLLWEYYWDTIDTCVPAETVINTLRDTGFADVKHHKELGLCSEYTAQK
jgi:demethylmenaquinone methyltransferase/2-methoxy-6-polyprenyl-1,4-benzoquinol methylase